MTSLRYRVAATIAAVPVALVVTACSGGSGKLPAGADLLKQSSSAMASVTSVGFSLRTEGQPGIPVKSADGKLLKSGDAQGNMQISQLGLSVQLDFTLVGNTVYVKGLTGGIQKLDKSAVTKSYDPSAILDPQRGVSSLLSKAVNPQTEAKESVAGQDAYRVKATMPKDAAASIIPGLTQDVPGQAWISAKDHRLLKVKATVPGTSGNSGSVTVTLSDFNGNFTITPPTS
jgi:lipoprotein LprG